MNQEILNRFLRCKTSESEELQIMDWLDENLDNQKELQLARELLESMALAGTSVDTLPKVEVARPLTMRRIVNYTMTAAAIFLCVVASTYTYIQYDREQWASRLVTLEVPRGQRINIELQDGTFVQLNSGSKLEYPTAFAGDTRKIKLSGEALFDVKHNVKQPFIVETFACDVEVLGTEFNVYADEKNREFSTVLIDGSVKVTNRESKQEIVMSVNDVVDFRDGTLFLSQIDGSDSYCWTKGQLKIDNLSFEQLMYRFEIMYDVKIVVGCDVKPIIEGLSGKLRLADGVEHAMGVVKLAADFNYTYNKDKSIITIN